MNNIFKAFLQYNLNHITNEKTSLHLAVEIGNLKIIKLLLDQKNIDVKVEDEILIFI